MTTILAAFNDITAAHTAAVQLKHAGFAGHDVQVEHDLARLRAMDRSRRVGNDSVLGTAGRMFADIIQTNVNHHQLDVVTEALERAACVVVARATEPALADQAVALLRAAGAFNVGVHKPADMPR
jgi:hypothetical protein